MGKKDNGDPATYFLLFVPIHQNKHHRKGIRFATAQDFHFFYLFNFFLSTRYLPAHKEVQPPQKRDGIVCKMSLLCASTHFGSSNFPVEPLELLFPLEFAHKLNVP
jgi:hypothetical protein